MRTFIVMVMTVTAVMGLAWVGQLQAATVTYQTAASADDTYCTSTGANYANTLMYWPYGSAERRNFARWAINIPAGAVINSAYVKVKSALAAGGTATVQMQLVDADSCADFTTNPWPRTVVGSTVNWAFGATALDTWYTSPDVSAIVQGYIDRGGYSTGSYLGLRAYWVSGGHRRIYAWNYSDHTHGPKLEVTYTTNDPPVADAGDDQLVHDGDRSGAEQVTLDGSGSSDSDGTIASYVWKEGANQIATGATPSVSLAAGTHTITLTVTDDDGATAADTVAIEVNTPPTASAGNDQTVTDTDLSGAETVTLNASGSSDSDGTIAGYLWKEGDTQLATTSSADVSLAVGVHTVTLAVTDNDGGTASDTLTVTVNSGLITGTLTYAYGTTNTTYHYRPLYITASYDSETIWTMTVWVPEAGFTTSNDYWSPGEIASFKDVIHGGTPFDYSPESASVVSGGLMRMCGMQGTFLDGTSVNDHSWQTEDYFEFTKTYTITPGVVGTLTQRINAPIILGDDDYKTTIDGNYTVANTSGANFDIHWGTGSTAGSAALALAHGGYTDWAFINPTSSTTKPNLHQGNSTDGHRLYTVYDWFGSMVTSAVPGWFAKQIVNDNEYTASRNMRPGLGFELKADAMNLFYTDAANHMYGYTAAHSTGGVRCSTYSQPGVFGSAPLPTGQSATLNWLGTICTVPFTISPMAKAGPDQEVSDVNSSEDELISFDASDSVDADGSVVSWVWMEGSTQVASGETAQATLGLGVHTIKLIVTDDDGATAEDTLVVNVKFNGPFYVDQSHASADDANFGTESLPWKTIAHATMVATEGQTVYIKEGTYRESVTVAHSGSSQYPINFLAYGDDKVVISGSDILTGWTQLGSTSRNANYASIYYVDVNWNVEDLFEDEVQVAFARAPNGAAYWQPEAGSTNTQIINSNLTQASSSYWVGAIMKYLDRAPVTSSSPVVQTYDPATHKVTFTQILDPAIDPNGPAIGVDCFSFINRLELIDVPGEWACEDQGGGTWRVYIWPTDDDSAANHFYEAPKRGGTLFNWGGNSHLVIDGLQIVHGTNIGIGGGGSDITISNCTLINNDYIGLQAQHADGVTVTNSLVAYNGFGLTFSHCTNVAVEYNELCWNNNDGIQVSGADGISTEHIYINNNYIHDHFLAGHPDGIQTYNTNNQSYQVGVSDIWIENNVIINSGQGIIFAETDGAHVINNIVMGSAAAVIAGGASSAEYLNNTVGMAGYGTINFAVAMTGCTMKNNIWFQGHASTMTAFDTTDQVCNYNNYFQGYNLSTYQILKYNGTYYHALNTYVAASGKDTNSLNANPLFVNAPVYYDSCDEAQVPNFTTTRVYLKHAPTGYAVNDYIEYSFDGVARQLTAIGANYIEFTPALPALPVTAGSVCNWKANNSNYAIDFSLAGNSPCLDAGEGGVDMGSSLSMASYRAGDVDGDGYRDMPEMP